MKIKSLILISLLQVFFSCSDEKAKPANADSDLDAASHFIRASLDNNFEEAKQYLVNDSTNIEYLDAVKRNRAHLTKDENFNYREASIRVYDTRKINDSTSIISYSNSYKNQKDSVKAIRTNGKWLIDFKYSFPTNISK